MENFKLSFQQQIKSYQRQRKITDALVTTYWKFHFQNHLKEWDKILKTIEKLENHGKL